MMKNHLSLKSIFIFTLGFAVLGCVSLAGREVKDPFLWLEEIEGQKALDWVDSQNKKTLDALTSDPQYEDFENYMKQVLMAKDRIPTGQIRDGYVYNFWQDKKNVRGLWRRVKQENYFRQSPQWTTLLSIDELAEKENQNWVFKRVECAVDAPNLCLIFLSQGGKDATVVREFDLTTKSFVSSGFVLPEAKTSVRWWDQNHLLVATDFGPGTVTTSGYPRIVKVWKRGTPLSEAKTLFSGREQDVYISAHREYGSGGRWGVVSQSISFYDSKTYVFRDIENPQLMELPIPSDAEYEGVFNKQVLVNLKSDWSVQGQVFSSGSIVSFNIDEFMTRKQLPKVDLMFKAQSHQAVQSLLITRSAVLLNLLEDVKPKIVMYQKRGSRWISRHIKLPGEGSLYIIDSRKDSGLVQFTYQNYLNPTELYYLDVVSRDVERVKRLPAKFDASGYVVQQQFAVSRDGTKVPYFVVSAKNLKLDGSHKTLLYGYGGFQVSQTPFYSAASGKLWLEQGGVHVYANIRGGGEYGPSWHQAALKENRQRAFDDFIAIAEDLISRKVTTPEKLAIMGGSNGGLLVSAVMVQRSELFKAVICQVPLTDMLRYHKLLAGASWKGEYGDPEDSEMRKVLKAYSPYHNIKLDQNYPHVLFVTSTKDDRVHPAHARKLAAKMEEFGKDFYYFENRDGGHGVSANLEELAKRTALQYVYLHRLLQ